MSFGRPCLVPGPRDVRMHVAASVQDVVIQDLRARKEHRWGEAKQLRAAVRVVREQAPSRPRRRLHHCLPPGTAAHCRLLTLACPLRIPPSLLPHSLVLIPHGGEDFCTLELAFTSFVDPRRAGPRLNILVQVGAGAGGGAGR